MEVADGKKNNIVIFCDIDGTLCVSSSFTCLKCYFYFLHIFPDFAFFFIRANRVHYKKKLLKLGRFREQLVQDDGQHVFDYTVPHVLNIPGIHVDKHILISP